MRHIQSLYGENETISETGTQRLKEITTLIHTKRCFYKRLSREEIYEEVYLDRECNLENQHTLDWKT